MDATTQPANQIVRLSRQVKSGSKPDGYRRINPHVVQRMLAMKRSKTKPFQVQHAGTAAIRAADAGAPLYVRSLGGPIVPAGPGALARAKRMSPHANWIYVTGKP